MAGVEGGGSPAFSYAEKVGESGVLQLNKYIYGWTKLHATVFCWWLAGVDPGGCIGGMCTPYQKSMYKQLLPAS